MALPSPSDSTGPVRDSAPLPSDADGWLVERLVDLDPAGRARFAQRLRAEGDRLATRAEQYVRAFDGTLAFDLSRALRGPTRATGPDVPAAPLASPLAAGETVGAYRVVREIGRGGMGVVYLAERDDLGLQAALKVLDEPTSCVVGGVSSSDDALRFDAERRHLARLSHPGVPRIYDAGQTATGLPFYAMELVEGVPLDEHVRDRGLGERMALFVQLCEVVRHVHARGLAHGDVKPANVLVQRGEPPVGSQRPQPVVRLVDFGVAEETSGPLVPGPRPFTPAYAAPEIFAGAAPSAASDIYGLGAVLGDLVTSCPERPPRPERNGTRPSEPDTMPLFDVIIRATRPASDERYESVDALLADVREAAAAVAWSRVPVVRGDSPPPLRVSTRSSDRPQPRPSALAVPSWAALVGAAAGAAVGWWSARRVRA
ncbi:serine/threonine-protein kinase [Rubricoccus marinus]|uniref:Protein kinase domain-containing protein n=1 Tax=Rubricoccus marinus TaxID=716817 RepID=A0A259TTU8_9BACT|nr:serine/threonine-protein kinase [Rubricoccus marinus]OZC01155.1 hypothetical protein BSZ36_18735 [Rubricoccus marinus]